MELKMGPNTILQNPTLNYLDGQTVRTGEMLVLSSNWTIHWDHVHVVYFGRYVKIEIID